MEKIWLYLAVGLGSALGGVGRFWISNVFMERFGHSFPWGTILVNVTGSFIIGLFVSLTGPEGRVLVHPRFSQFFVAGLCGGYTTFSSFSLQTLNLAREGQYFYAAANAALSVILCLMAVWLGHVAGQAFHR